MAYTVNKTDGSVFASVADGAIDTTSSLVLIGRNTTNYGEYIAENFIKGLENFAHTSAPASPLTGQLFFNKNDNLLNKEQPYISIVNNQNNNILHIELYKPIKIKLFKKNIFSIDGFLSYPDISKLFY